MDRQEEKGGNVSFLSEISMKTATEAGERLSGYRTADKTGEQVEGFLGISILGIGKREIDERIEEILDTADELFDNRSNPVLSENLLDSLNSSLDNLWEVRQEREREFSKLIVLVKTITKPRKIDLASETQIRALFELIQIFKRPKIAEIDVKLGVKILKEAKLDLYGPLKTKAKLKITIEEEE